MALVQPSAPPASKATLSFASPILGLGVVLLAFLLRIYNLTYESLDIDEADSVFFAQADLPTLLARITQPGENGPLYFLLLRAWMMVAGQSEFALRYLSLLPGVLAVPLLYAVGKRLLGPRVGVMAALLFTTSTYLLFYAQMAKMYSLVVFVSLLSSYLLLRALERPSLWRWAGYTVITTAAFYTHIFTAFLVPWHSLFVVLTLRRHRSALIPWAVSLGALTLPYMPIGLQRLQALQAPETLNRQFTGPRDLLGMLATLVQEYGTRYDLLPPPLLSGLFLALTLLGLLALLASSSPRRGEAWVFIGVGIVLPLLVTYGFVALGAPLFSSRYLIVTLPNFYLLWSAALVGVAGWGRLLSLALLVGFLLLNGARWAQTHVGGERFREDWRSAVAYLEQRYLPGDKVLAVRSWDDHSIQYYASRPLVVETLTAGEGRPPDPQGVSGLPSSGRIWLIAAYFEIDELPPVLQWLDETSQIMSQKWHVGVMVSLYLTKRGDPAAEATVAPLATFDGHLLLTDYQTAPLPERPGAPWQATLQWRAQGAPLEAYWAALELVDERGEVWGSAEGPVGGQFYPTERWPEGFSIREVRELEVAPGIRPGVYGLTVRVRRGDHTGPTVTADPGHDAPGVFRLGAIQRGQHYSAQ